MEKLLVAALALFLLACQEEEAQTPCERLAEDECACGDCSSEEDVVEECEAFLDGTSCDADCQDAWECQTDCAETDDCDEYTDCAWDCWS